MTSPADAEESPAAQPDDDGDGRHPPRRRLAPFLGVVATVAILAAVGWLWLQSLVPGTYSVMDMGYPDYGGGPVPADGTAAMDGGHGEHGSHGSTGSVRVDTLLGPSGRPDVSLTLTARAETIHLDGEDAGEVAGFTLNHESPGPRITADVGDLVQVRLVNESVPDGIALHWHGVDVPNGEDGVAGVTQDAVEEGEEYVYRFVAEDAGTYWYHSHQVSDEQVVKGLLGPLVVAPAATSPAVSTDTVAVVHSYSGRPTVNGALEDSRVQAEPGSQARIRVINTNNTSVRTWVSGAGYQLLAIDGRDVNGPEEVEDQTVVVPAGGRADLLVTVPADGSAATVSFGSGPRLVVGPSDGDPVTGDDPHSDLDLLSYGSPADIGFDPTDADRDFEYRIGRRIAFLDGRPGFWWSINGHLYPDVPMFTVEEGDVVTMTISNSSGKAHPMHLHGHHAVVLSRDGEAASGSPWWVDSLQVGDGETYVIAFVADNPGIWMDHCHNLPHASQGLVTHLMYAGVTTPFVIGGSADNDPE